MKNVLKKNGHLIFNVGGKDIVPIAYTSYFPNNADYNVFQKAGYNLFSACIYMGDMPVNELSGVRPFQDYIWKDRQYFDFSPLDKIVKQTLGEKCAGYLMLRINVNVPSWWRKENPDELVKLTNGKTVMQSSFSEKWIQDVQLFLDKLKAHIEKSCYAKNVIAWQIAAMNTEEWIAPIDKGAEPDLSVCAQKEFSKWCKEKYGNIESLNTSWNSCLRTFLEVQIPSDKMRASYYELPVADIKKHAQTIDFYRCFNQSYATAINRLCGYVKSLFNGDMLVGTFYGYIGQLGCNSGHCSFKELLHSKNVDFFASPFAYTDARQTANDWFYHSAIESCKRAGKLWFIESDVRTFKTKSLYESVPNTVEKDNAHMLLPVWFGPTTEEQSIWDLTRAFSKVLISDNAFWWFDMWGGWYRSENIMRFMQRAKELYDYSFSKPYRSVSEVAVILDEESAYGMNIRYGGQARYLQMVELGNAGAPYELYLKGDFVAEDLRVYKCIIYIAPFEITDSDKQIISELDKAGKTIIITGKSYPISGERVKIFDKPVNEKIIRVLYESAGVHIYTDKTGLIFANADYISITASEETEYALKMPYDCGLQSVFNNEFYETENCIIRLSMHKKESKLFKILKNQKLNYSGIKD